MCFKPWFLRRCRCCVLGHLKALTSPMAKAAKAMMIMLQIVIGVRLLAPASLRAFRQPSSTPATHVMLKPTRYGANSDISYSIVRQGGSVGVVLLGEIIWISSY